MQVARRAGWEKLISENRSLPALTIRVFEEACNLRCTCDFQTSRELEGSVVGQGSHIANASVDLEVSVTDAYFMMTPAKEPRATLITSTPTAGEHLPLHVAVDMSDGVEENEAQDSDAVEEN